jgi:WD40 repeat protein
MLYRLGALVGASCMVERLELVRALGSTVLRHNGGIRAVRVTPDGKRILSIGDGPEIHVWDSTSGQRIVDLAGTDRGLYSLAIAPDGKRVFAGGHEAQIFELPTRRRVASLPVGKPLIVAAAFGPDSTVVFGDDRLPRRFDRTGAELAPLEGHQARIDAIAISPDGRRAVTCGGDGTIKLQTLDTRKPEVLASWPGHARSCGFSPDGTLAWSAGWDHAIVRGTTSGKPTFIAKGLRNIRTAASSADGARLAIASEDAIVVHALPGGAEVARIAFAGADTLAFTPDRARLVVGHDGRGLGEGCAIQVFELASERRVLPGDAGHAGAVEALAVAAELPHVLYSLGSDGLLAMWDAETGTAMERLGSVTGQGRALASIASGQTVVTVSDEGELLAWRVARTESQRFGVEGRSGVATAISPDGTLVAYAPYMPGLVEVFALETRERVMVRKPHRAQMCAVAFAGPDVVITSAADGNVIASRVSTEDGLWTASCDGFVQALCVIGDAVVSGTSSGQLAIWEVATGALRGTLRASGRAITHACRVDPEHVAILLDTIDQNSSLELWSVTAGQVVATAALSAPGDRARSLVAAPDGGRLYVGTNSSRILVFERARG